MRFFIIALSIFLVLGCSTSDEEKEAEFDLTGLGYFDGELVDYVFYIEKIEISDAVTENSVGLAVLKENSYFDSVFVTIDRTEYEMQDLAGGQLWSGEAFSDIVTNEGDINTFTISAYGSTLIDNVQEPYTYNVSFSIENCNDISNPVFPDSLYTTQIDQTTSDTLYIADDADLVWQLAADNQYQLLSVNKSSYATPDDYEIELEPSERSTTITGSVYENDPRNVDFQIAQVNGEIIDNFASFSKSIYEKKYMETSKKIRKPLFERIKDTIKHIQ